MLPNFKSKYFISIILIFFIKINYLFTELISFPFKTINWKKNSSYDYISTIYSNELYTNLKLGSLETKLVPAIISHNEIAFSIDECSYNLKNSTNYNESSLPWSRSFVWEKIEKGILFEDLLYVNAKKEHDKNIKEKFFNTKFIYVENRNASYIGLNFPDLYEHNVISIFKTLKDNKLIDNYEWCPIINKNRKNKYIDYNDIDGELIIGGNYSHYQPEIFDEKYITNFEMNSHGQYVEYTIKFQDIYVGDQQDKNSLYYKQVYFGLNFLTIGSLEYETKIANLFFNDLIEKQICYVKPMDIFPEVHYYYCKRLSDLDKKFDINLFPKLCLLNKNISFCFRGDDLFIEDPNNKDILYFTIGFMKFDPVDDFPKYFHFGIQFLSKYQLCFDPKNKIIAYYGFKEEYNPKKKSKSYSYIIYISIIVILAIILFSLGMLLQKKLTKIPRKIRANELNDDDFLYEKKECDLPIN